MTNGIPALAAASVSRRGFLLGAGAAAVFGSTLLAGCAPSGSGSGGGGNGNGGGSGGEKTLNVMLASWVDPAFIEEVMQKSAAGPLGVKLNLMTVDDGTYPAQALAAQKSGQVPDLIFWTAQGIPTLLATGVKLADISDYAASEDTAAFYEQNYAASTIGGKLYGLGFRCQSRGIAYRRDFADAAGLSVPDAWSFDEFGDFASGMRDGDRFGFAFEAKVGDGRASSNVLPLLWSTGAKVVKGDAGAFETGFTKDQLGKVLGFYSDTVHDWKSTPTDVANWGYQETDGNFARGVIGSYSAGPFVFQQVQQFADTRDNLAVAPLPNGGTPASFWEEHTLMVHEDSPNRDLALEFLANMRSVETQTLIASREGDAQLSVRSEVNANEIKNEALKGFGALLDDAVVPEAVNIAPIMNNVLLPAIGAVSLKSGQVDAAVDQAMAAMETTLTELNRV